MNIRVRIFILTFFVITAFILISPESGRAQSEALLSAGQTVYVPASTSVYIRRRGMEMDMVVTLIVRNIDQKKPIRLISIDYYGHNGRLIENFLSGPYRLAPLTSHRILLDSPGEKKRTGGVCFIVKWESVDGKVNAPLMESIMIGTESTQGISFTKQGIVLRD